MDLLATAATPIPSHTVLALLAVLMGGIQLALAKGTSAHRWLGWVWVSADDLRGYFFFFYQYDPDLAQL